MRALLLSGLLPALALGQMNASSDMRPVALEMNEANGNLTFSLQNQFNRRVDAYKITVWTFRDGVPRPACTLSSDNISIPRESSVKVLGSCAIPRNPATGDLLRYTAKLTSVRVDGRLIYTGPLRVHSSGVRRR